MTKKSYSIIIFIWFFLSLLIFYSGHIYSNDTLTKAVSAKNFIENLTFEIPYGDKNVWGISGSNNAIYPWFSVGSILMMFPPVLLHKAVSVFLPIPWRFIGFFISLFNVFYTALIGVFFSLFFLLLGKSFKNAFLYAVILLFTTEFLQYSSTGWSEPAAFLSGLIAFFVWAYKDEYIVKNKIIINAIIIFFISISLIIRIELFSFFTIFIAVNVLYKDLNIKKSLIILFIFLIVFSAHLFFNYYRFGSFFKFACFGNSTASTAEAVSSSGVLSVMSDFFRRFTSLSFIQNLFRFYISFGRLHWFWVSPVLITLPLFLLKLKTIPQLAQKIFLTSVIFQLVVLAMGSNSWCWGNRYLYTSFPYLMLPVIFVKKNKITYKLLLIMSFIGFIIAVLSSIVNYHVAQEFDVTKYGYNTAMFGTNGYFVKPSFLTHVELFPKFLVNTIELIWVGNNIASWDILRVSCFDIWPVTMCGAGINSFISFGLWFLFIVLWFFYTTKIVIPFFKTNLQ